MNAIQKLSSDLAAGKRVSRINGRELFAGLVERAAGLSRPRPADRRAPAGSPEPRRPGH